MEKTEKINRSIVLASLPAGVPTEENFWLETSPMPLPGVGQVRILYVI